MQRSFTGEEIQIRVVINYVYQEDWDNPTKIYV